MRVICLDIGEKRLFTGDTLFCGGYGRFDFPGGSLVDLRTMAPDDAENKSGMTPDQQLNCVFDAVRPHCNTPATIFATAGASYVAASAASVLIRRIPFVGRFIVG